MSDKNVALTIKKYAEIAGLDKNKYSGHSLRSICYIYSRIRCQERSIMAMTGHKTTAMVRRYIKKLIYLKIMH